MVECRLNSDPEPSSSIQCCSSDKNIEAHLPAINSNTTASADDRNENKMDDVDVIGRINGNFGKWQFRTVLLIFLCKIPSAWFMACIIFTAPAPREGEFFCHPSTNVLNSRTQEKFQRMLDYNKTAWVRLMHPIEKNEFGEDQIDFCHVYANGQKVAEQYFHSLSSVTQDWVSPTINTTTTVVPCKQFYHHTDFVSLVTDYNLVCSKDILIASTQFFHLFGVLTGGLLATYLLKQ